MMPLRVHLPNNSDMNPLELRSGIGPQADAVKDMSGLPTPMDRTPFVLFTGSRAYSPAATSSFFLIPQTLEGLITKMKFRAGVASLCADAALTAPLSYPVVDMKIGTRNISDSPLTLLPAPPAGGLTASQFNLHVLDRPEGVIELNYPLPPNSLIQLIFQSRLFDTLLNYFGNATETFTASLEIEGILWTRQV
jgi:hypothetical protein